MADRIKGITIEIGGDTTGLNKALKGVNGEIRNTQSQLKDVERLLKLDPTNTELLRQKHRLLAEAVGETKDKLETLKTAEKQAQEQFKQGKISQEQYEGLKREIEDTERRLKTLQEQAGRSYVALEKIGQAGEGLKKIGEKTTEVGKAMLPLTAATAAAGAAAGKMALDFEDSMANINTLLDDESHLKGYEQAVIDLSNETGKPIETMTEGMYQAISSLGDAGKETEEIFGTMARSAKAGGAEVADSVSLISAGMKGYNSVSGETAQKISDLAFQTAKLGVTTFPEMARSMQPLFPLASSVGLSFEELFGVMATGTGVTGNTSEVSTQLKAVLSNLMKPTKQMKSLMKEYGYENGQAMIESEGLTGVLKILQEATGGQSDKMAELFSSTEALTLMTALTGTQFDTFGDKLLQMSDAAGATAAAYDKLKTGGDDIRNTMNLAKNTAMEFGQTLIQEMGPVIREICEKVKELCAWFRQLDDGQQKNVIALGLLVAALGPTLIAIGQMTAGIGALMQGLQALGPVFAVLGTAGGPVLAGAVAFGIMVEAMSRTRDETDLYAESLKTLTPEEQKHKDAVESLKQSYDDMSSRRTAAIESAGNQAEAERRLWEELQTLVDENGNVKAGCEEQAEVITGQLAGALGIEIDLTKNQIKNYQDLCANIDELIQKKQANALLDAGQEAYTEALSKQTDAFMVYNQAKKDVEATTWEMLKAQEEESRAADEINRLWKENIATGQDVTAASEAWSLKQQEAAAVSEALGEKLEGLNQSYADAQQAYVGYNTVIENYKGLSAAIVSGDQAAISDAVLRMTNDFQTAETGTRESLTRQSETFREKLAEMEKAVREGAPGITEEQLKNMKNLVKMSDEELKKLPEIAKGATKETAKAVTGEAPELEKAGKDITKSHAKGIEDGGVEVKKAAEKLSEDTVNQFKTGYGTETPDGPMRETGRKVVEELGSGMEDGKDSLLLKTGELSDGTIGGLRERLQRQEFAGIGSQIPIGLAEGIESERGRAIASAEQLCDDVVTASRGRLGIHSPSTEFAYMGQMSGEGLIEGFVGMTTEIGLAIETSLTEIIAKTTEICGSMDQVMMGLRDSSGNVIAEIVENTEEAQEALQGIQDKLGETISGQISMFDEFDGKSKLTTEELLKNMQSQVDGTQEWSDNLRMLAEKGIDQGLLQKLADMGPKGAGYVTTFSQMTDDELRRANELWTQTMTLPQSTAESIMQSYRIAGTMTALGFKAGIDETASEAAEAGRQVAIQTIESMNESLDINSPSGVAEEAGRFFTEGFAVGIPEGIELVTAAVNRVTSTVTSSLKSNLSLSQGDFAEFQGTTAAGWTAWAQGLEETLRATLARISTETGSKLRETQTIVTTYITNIEKTWKTKMQEIRKSHEETMTAISTKTTESMTETSKTVETETNRMKQDATTAMREMVSGMREELSQVEPTIRGGFEPGVAYITGLIGEARTWGNHMMQELIQGLRDYLEELEEVCEDIAETMSENLHFTKPDKGPLRNYEEWMPHFMQGLAKGIEDNRYLVAEQIRKLTDDMAVMQNRDTAKPVINFRNQSILVLDGEQIGETVDEYLGGAYG